MKKFVLFLAVLCLGAILQAKTPTVTFNLSDGTSKQYQISDIDKFNFISAKNSSFMKVFYQDSLVSNYQSKNIESIYFDKDASNYGTLNIVISGVPEVYILNDIDSINFFIPDVPVAQLTSMNPTSLKIGDVVTITGTNLGSTQGKSIVSFNNNNVTEYISWSDTEIKVKVPKGTVTGKLSATVNGIKSNDLNYTMISFLKSITPVSGKAGDVISFIGESFGVSQGKSFVRFTDTNAVDYQSWNDTLIKVKVPKAARTGNVSVTASGLKTNELPFSVLPKLDSISPNFARIGDTVVFIGTGFGIGKDTSFVNFFGKKAIDYISRTENQVKVKVPVGTKTGKASVTTAGNKSNELDFGVLPTLKKVTPDSAGVTESVAINGSGFGDKQGSSFVSFNDINATNIKSWTDTDISLDVPTGASSGKLTVSVNLNKSNGLDFTVTQHLTSVNPYALKVGDQITINGSNFGSSQGTSYVLLNSIKVALYDSWNDTEIKLKIPNNARSGKITVVIGTWKSNTMDFVLIPEISDISPTQLRPGDACTINGNSFDDTQSGSIVSFTGGNAMVITSWSNTQIILKAPAGAVTGKVSVTVNAQKSNEKDYSILPTVTGISPAYGIAGDQVTLTGVSFGDTRGASIVSFTGADASQYTTWTDRQIVVVVPVGVAAGKVSVTVAGNKSNEVDFSLTPQITNINPNSAAPNHSVTITGTSFGSTRGTNTVTFNMTTATSYQSWSNTSITVTVPVGASTGKVYVTVNTAKSNDYDFTVLPPDIETVTIGSQVWMLYNLDVTTYRNGDAIPECTSNSEWAGLTTGAWCYYNNSSSNGTTYGRLYNWYAVNDSRGLAPNGYHIPTDNEWTTLSNYLGGDSQSGGALKESGTSHWNSPNTNASNSSGFTALPGGDRWTNGSFENMNTVGLWWTTSMYDATYPWHVRLYSINGNFYHLSNLTKVAGCSVRCIKD